MALRESWLSSLAATVARSVGQALRRGTRPGRRGAAQPPATRRRSRARRRAEDAEAASPGRFGDDATCEVDPHRIGPVRLTYHPDKDGDPDPGEIVWTWVPFEEHDGRGKDRPVLVVAAESDTHPRTVLAVQLTSRNHSGDDDFIAIGTGSWDGEGRPSWVNIDRVVRVFPTGMRREAAALDARHYSRVEAALRQRYGWR